MAVSRRAIILNNCTGCLLLESKKQEFTAYKDGIFYTPLNTTLPTLPAMPVFAAFPGFDLAAVIPRARFIDDGIPFGD